MEKLLALFYVVTLCAASMVKVLPFTSPLESPNILYQVFKDIGTTVPVFQTLNEVSPQTLVKYGVIKIASTKSVIMNLLLMQEAFDPNYDPKNLESLNSRTMKSKDASTFYEISYEDCDQKHEVSDWVPISSCIENTRTSMSSSYSQGWSLSQGSGLMSAIEFSQIFGIEPSISLDVTYGTSISGSLSCSVDAGNTLQFQLKYEKLTTSKVKQRDIRIVSKIPFLKHSFSKLEIGDWEECDDYTEITTSSVSVACVTDPELLRC